MGLFDNPGAVAIEMHFGACINCGITFGYPQEYDARLRKTHQNFYCPNGHGQQYSAKTEEEKLRDEKVRLTQQLDQTRARAETWKAESERNERRLRSTKGVVTGMRRRLHKGKCTHCSKSFPDLATHMQSAHPEKAPEGSAKP